MPDTLTPLAAALWPVWSRMPLPPPSLAIGHRAVRPTKGGAYAGANLSSAAGAPPVARETLGAVPRAGVV